MRIRSKAVLDFAAIFGAILLFGSWAFQQTLLNKANKALEAIHARTAEFETYQSHNTTFNALIAAFPKSASDMLRFKIQNYNYAFDHLEQLLTKQEVGQLPPRVGPFDGDWNPDTAESKTQARINAIWPVINAKENAIAARNSFDNSVFFVLYAVGSLLVLGTSAYKTFFQTTT